VVGAYFPSFAGIILAICCFVVAGLQPVGFVGVLRVCPCPLIYPIRPFTFDQSVNGLLTDFQERRLM